MGRMESRIAREAKEMTRIDVVKKAEEGRITWLQAADVLGLTPRQMLRVRKAYVEFGIPGLRDRRTGRRMPSRLDPAMVEELCRLRREKYADFSIRHFHEFATEKHQLRISYTWTRIVLQMRGLADKAPSRGKYRRKRERRPMVGMMMHLDASTHAWLPGRPMQDLMVALDDADGRILFARFFPQEGVFSTLWALRHVLVRYGRFCEFYTDRGSHFCRTTRAAEGPDAEQYGQVSRALKALGIRQILARSPEARGRSERCFKTIQGRLPQELRLRGISSYEEANRYLETDFVPDFNRRFTVVPQQPEQAFTSMKGLDLDLLLSIQHDRQVRKDNTVQFDNLVLQLPSTAQRIHFVRCPVLVHEFLDDTLGVSYQGQLVARFDRTAAPLAGRSRIHRKAA
jgi:hypothetical protein